MNVYRCYFLDQDDHIESAEWIEAPTLEDAIEQGLTLCGELGACAIEVWQGANRLYHAPARIRAAAYQR